MGEHSTELHIFSYGEQITKHLFGLQRYTQSKFNQYLITFASLLGKSCAMNKFMLNLLI